MCSLGPSQVGRMNFGKDVSTLKFFTICGLQEGYEPFAVNTNRDITIWLSKRLPQFLPVPQNHEHIEVCNPIKMFLDTSSMSLFKLSFCFCTSRQDFKFEMLTQFWTNLAHITNLLHSVKLQIMHFFDWWYLFIHEICHMCNHEVPKDKLYKMSS